MKSMNITKEKAMDIYESLKKIHPDLAEEWIRLASDPAYPLVNTSQWTPDDWENWNYSQDVREKRKHELEMLVKPITCVEIWTGQGACNGCKAKPYNCPECAYLSD